MSATTWKSAVLFLLVTTGIAASAQQTTLQLDPAKTTIRFTLDAALHTVHGTFQTKPSVLQFDSGSGQVSGEIVVDAKSGETGNGMRDRKMHKDVLESESYPEVSFRPDRIEGVVGDGKSSVKVHGMFRIHGVDREITVPAEVAIFPDHWTAALHFTIPYAKWGMRNPSTLFLRVSDSVEIDIAAAGTVVQNNSPAGSGVQ
ncbi:MAG TPA: YceI family protein [Terriglobales bacterium]|nr:YceI family protein [Terriglobales bacterium]